MSDAVADMVARGYGTLCVGNGRMVHYGKEPSKRCPGMAWIDNEIRGAAAERLIGEAIVELAEDARRASKAKGKREVIVSEADA